MKQNRTIKSAPKQGKISKILIKKAIKNVLAAKEKEMNVNKIGIRFTLDIEANAPSAVIIDAPWFSKGKSIIENKEQLIAVIDAKLYKQSWPLPAMIEYYEIDELKSLKDLFNKFFDGAIKQLEEIEEC